MTTPLTAPGVDASGSSTHAGTTLSTRSPRSAGTQRPAASSAAMGAKMSRPWNVALGLWMPNMHEARRGELHHATHRDARRRSALAARCPAPGTQWPPAVTAMMSREVPTPGSTTATCTVPGGKVAERARQPEARFGRPVHDDLVREIDDARVGEAAEHHALHDADERARCPKSVVIVMTPMASYARSLHDGNISGHARYTALTMSRTPSLPVHRTGLPRRPRPNQAICRLRLFWPRASC